MARPRIAEDERRTIVACRLTPELRRFVEERAEARGLTISAWVERCIADAKNRMEIAGATSDTLLFGRGAIKVTRVPLEYRQQAGPSEIITGEAKPSPRSAGSHAAARPIREGSPQSPPEPAPTVQLGPTPAAPGSRLKKR